MMEGGVEAGEVSVEVKSGIEEVKVVSEVDVEAESDGKGDVNNDIVTDGNDEYDNSYVLVSGSDVMVEDAAERGNVRESLSGSEVLGESGVKDDEANGVDGKWKGEYEKDGKTSGSVENGVLVLSNDGEESHLGESDKDELKTEVVEEIDMVDEEAGQGEVGQNLKVEETIEVEYSNKFEDVTETVNVIPKDSENKSQQIISVGAVDYGDAVIGISNPIVEEKLNPEIEIIGSNESEHAKEELEKESNEENFPVKKENQDFEHLMELDKEGNGEISHDKRGNQESEDLVPSDAQDSVTELDQAGQVSLIDESLPGKKVTMNKEPHLSEEGHSLVIGSEVSSCVKENGKCESLIPVDEFDFNSEEKNNSANVSTVESSSEYANTVIPNEHETAASAIPKINSVNGNNIDSCQIGKSEAATAISTGQKETGLDFETLADALDNETAASAILKTSSVNGNEKYGNNTNSDASSCQIQKSETANAISTGQEETGLESETQADAHDNETAASEILKTSTVNGNDKDRNNTDSDASSYHIQNYETANAISIEQEENVLECERQADVNENEIAARAISNRRTVNGKDYINDKINIDSDASSYQIEKSEAASAIPTEQEENVLESETQADVNDNETAAVAISNMITLNNNGNDGHNIDSDACSCQIGETEAANAISTEQDENGLECEIQADVIDNDTTEAEQSTSKDILLILINQDKKELANEINNGLPSFPVTECVGEVVEPVTDTCDSNAPNDDEWPELSYYTTKRKISTELTSEVLGGQEFEITESEEIHLANRDRKEVHNGSAEDDDLNGHKEEVGDASLSEDSENACHDLETSKYINRAGQHTNWADYNDPTDLASSSSVLSYGSHSHSISDGVISVANHENEVATPESGSKDDETNLNGKLEVTKIETSSEEESSKAVVDNEVDRSPFFFLIRVPRFEDDEIKGQIRFAQQDVDEKTKLRDSYKVPIQTKKDICMDFNNDLESAKRKEKAAQDNLKAKRREIDAAQAVIDKVNNAMTVDDIDGSIHIMEHRMQHETIPLSEEKQLMREIKRLKHFKEQLSFSIGSQEELQEALDQKDQIRDHLKSLKRELNLIRSDVQRTAIVTQAAKKKCFDAYAELNKLQLEFKAADDARQEAYLYLTSLRRESAQKNKFFWMYKDTEELANNYALSGDKKFLHSLCINQVETIMELWNKNDQFRKDYIKCNARSTLRRLKTFDGRSLGLGEESPSLPNIRIGRINLSELVTNSLSQIPPPEESKTHVPFVAEMEVVNKPDVDFMEKVAPKQSKSTTEVSEVSNIRSPEITPVTEEEVEKTKEDDELAMKAEEIRKNEEQAKLMERLQLEERAKAKEALERKKRMAEKAQARAKLRAKKEAEQREKEREKRLRKKEKKKDGKENGTNKDFIAVKEAQLEVTKEANTIEKPVTKKHHKPSHYVKGTKTSTMPLNLRNRNRRKMQMWMWIGAAALGTVAAVLVWFGYLSYLEEQERSGHHVPTS